MIVGVVDNEDWRSFTIKVEIIGVDCNISLILLMKEKKCQRNYIGEVQHCLEKWTTLVNLNYKDWSV
jgi:hypothetical protein